MKKIAIIGANGQVGAEITAYLAQRNDVIVTGFVRSTYSAALLELLHIAYETIDFTDTQQLNATLSSYDIVVDCTYPGGQTAEIPHLIQANIKAIMQAMQQGSIYIYMSSIMAFGMPNQDVYIKNYTLPRTTYARIKRQGEKYALKSGRQLGIKTVIFRLGQVHGILQGVTQEYITSLVNKSLQVLGDPDDLTTTIFASAISQAVIRCAKEEVEQGLYTLVSSPQWTLTELYDYYLDRYNLSTEIQYVPIDTTRTSLQARISHIFAHQLVIHRDLLETYILLPIPSLSLHIKGMFRQRSVAQDIRNLNQNNQPHSHLLGSIPEDTLPYIDSSPNDVLNNETKLSSLFNTTLNHEL